jgi:NADH dehydrogenase FAD-containing subunit
VVIDRTNHHVFQPLLYQVATAVLSPSQIGTSIRSLLGRQRNTRVLQGNVTGVDPARNLVIVESEHGGQFAIEYDHLVLATGAKHSYFAHPEYESFAPGLKSLGDAVSIRNKILQAFELAETEDDADRRAALLTFVLVGAGPTGVELAAALALLVRTTLLSEFRRADPRTARIVLVDMMPRVLGAFADDLSAAAKDRLEKLGVEICLGHGVDLIDGEGVVVAGERIHSRTVIWTAGVAPSPAGKWLGAPTDKAGRVRVQPDLRVPGHPNVFVIGDTASLDQDGKPLPGVAQVAMQQGRYVGRLLCRHTAGVRERKPPRPFRYFDKGTMAVVGKNFAVLQSGKVRLRGFVAWVAWALVHLEFLAQANLRISVFLQWAWTYATGRRGSRLIIAPQPAPGRASAAPVVTVEQPLAAVTSVAIASSRGDP